MSFFDCNIDINIYIEFQAMTECYSNIALTTPICKEIHMTDAARITPLGCPVPLNCDLTPEQSVDALEAVCDALHRAFRADFQHYCAKTSAMRIEGHADAYDAWHAVKVTIGNFAKIKSLSPVLVFLADQFLKLWHARLSQTDDLDLDSARIFRAVDALRIEPDHDARLAALVADAAAYVYYLRGSGLAMPDVSDLLTDT